MFFSNLKIFLKQLLRSKMYSAVTILGFSISLMFVILLSVYIEQELSVDKFHKNKDRIYRLTTGVSSSFAPPIGQRLKDKYPEIESFTRLFNLSGIISGLNQQTFRFNYHLVDSSFFTMFSFPLSDGNPREVLKAKNSIVLSKSFAKKIFGNDSPIGKEVEIDKRLRFIVTGIIEDIPENTHIERCDALVNFNSLADLWDDPKLLTSYDNCSFALYFMVKPNANIISKETEIFKSFKEDFWMYKWGSAKAVKFEPLTDIYFGQLYASAAKGNSKKVITIFSTIALLILILAIINYINLSVAQSSLRSREVAVKKLHGSSKGRLFMQFISESIIICIVAFNIALLLSKFAEPVFNDLFSTHLNLNQKLDLVTLLIYLGGIVLVGVISGLIPAFVITRFNAIEIVKGSFRRRSKSVFGKVLISFQYCTAIILIICTWIIAKQTSYMRTYDVGFKKDNIIFFDNDIATNQKEAFRSEITKISGVVDLAYTAGSPIDGGNNNTFNLDGKSVSFQVFKVDSAFIKMFGITIKPTGMAYSKGAICMNETAIKELGLDTLPKIFKNEYYTADIYGIVKDFHFRDLHQKIGPAIVRNLPKEKDAWSIFVKITGADQLKTIESIKKVHGEFTKGIPMEYTFVDERINEWYVKEEQASKIIGYFSLLAIIISVMGILAMATFYIEQRIKEIGIRKVNGATIVEIVRMLNFDLMKWVLIAFFVACPVAYYISMKWLQNFPYKTSISWWVFIASGFIALLFALATVSWQSRRAATRNPVEALKYE